jgi:regulator of sigma D
MKTSSSATSQERRSGSQDPVGKLITERTEMRPRSVVLPESSHTPDKPVQKLLQEFLSDPRRLRGRRATSPTSASSRQGAPAGSGRSRGQHLHAHCQTTDTALDFNDKYDCEDHCTALESLAGDLSNLGEELAARIELEDKLLVAMTRR